MTTGRALFEAGTPASVPGRRQGAGRHGDLSVLEELQRTNAAAEIWWDSPPQDFPVWRHGVLERAPDAVTRERWAVQLQRFLVPDDPERSLVCGVTTNPSLIAKSILNSPQRWSREVRRQAMQQEFHAEPVFRLLYRAVVAESAAVMMPMWQRSEGRYGWVSAQLDPRAMCDRQRMLDEALALTSLSPNIMAKVPGVPAGYEVIKELVARGISINNTLTCTVPQFLTCIRVVEEGLAVAQRVGIGADRWRAVITHMIGRYGSNGILLKEAATLGVELSPSDVRWAEVAILKEITQILGQGSHPVKMLVSSLEVDDPLSGAQLSMHLEQTAGADIVYTCKPDFVEATMRRERDLAAFAQDAIYRPVPADVLDRLNRLPYFRQAVEPGGMQPEQFTDHSVVTTTHSEMNRNVHQVIDFIQRTIDELPVRQHGTQGETSASDPIDVCARNERTTERTADVT